MSLLVSRFFFFFFFVYQIILQLTITLGLNWGLLISWKCFVSTGALDGSAGRAYLVWPGWSCLALIGSPMKYIGGGGGGRGGSERSISPGQARTKSYSVSIDAQ